MTVSLVKALTTRSINKDNFYLVTGSRIAWRYVAPVFDEREYEVNIGDEDDPMWIVDFDQTLSDTQVNMMMVGDDVVHTHDISDISLIPEDTDVCSCGQFGCWT